MLKRLRPATPPPSSLSDPPPSLPDLGIRRLPSHSVDPSQPCSKRRRVRPPPLDGALRGWLASEPAGPHSDSDGEEDWLEDAHDASYRHTGGSPPPSAAADQYKDANTLLHELHTLNQHRLSFAQSPRDARFTPSLRNPLPIPYAHLHLQDSPFGQRPDARSVSSDGSPHLPAHPQPMHHRPAGRGSLVEYVEDKADLHEVQCVRQRYEDANRLLGSLFLSRRREVECIASSPDRGPSSRHP